MSDEEHIEPEIARQLTIPKMRVPDEDHWKSNIPESQLENLKWPELRSVLIAISKLDQKQDYLLQWTELGNSHQRSLEARLIRQTSMKLAVVRWGVATLGAAVIIVIGSALGRRLLDIVTK